MDYLSRSLLSGAGSLGPLILVYHVFEDGDCSSKWPYAVSRKAFHSHIDLLAAEGWATVRVGDLASPAGCPARSVAITFDDGYADNFAAFEELAKRSMVASWFVLSGFVGGVSAWDRPALSPKPLLTASQLRTMAASGMEIGSHGATHRDLTQLADDELDTEVARSKGIFEEILGQTVRSFAYPYGVHDERVVAAVRRAGYELACTTASGWALAGMDLYRLRRITVFSSDSEAAFARKVAFADNHVGWGKVAKYVARRFFPARWR